jgi:hypothetical protein
METNNPMTDERLIHIRFMFAYGMMQDELSLDMTVQTDGELTSEGT